MKRWITRLRRNKNDARTLISENDCYHFLIKSSGLRRVKKYFRDIFIYSSAFPWLANKDRRKPFLKAIMAEKSK